MGWKSLKQEWLARRAGRRGLKSDLSRSARDIVGPTGWMWSKGWDAMSENASIYVESFDKRVPRSIFLSESERNRYNIPIPLVERMITEHRREEADDSPTS